MKKIILCGATHGSNFGDLLFAYMFTKNIQEKDKDIEILFTRASEYTKNEMGINVATIRDLFTADAMIYISGGYFGQSHNETLKGSLYRFLVYYTYGLLMIFRKKPIAILGAGAGPLNRWFLRKTVTYIFNKSKLISLRDETSKYYMIKYGVVKEIIATSDSAQVIDNDIYGVEFRSNIFSDIKLRNRKKILVHVAAPEEELYIKKVVMAIKETLCLKNNNGFIVTSDSSINEKYLNNVYSFLPKDRTIIYKYKNPIDFLNVINSVDAVITTKLHVGILGCTYGKSVMSFPIHPGKTERYYKQIGYSEHCKSLYSITKNEAKEMISKYIEKRIELPIEVKNKAQYNFDLIEFFINKYI